MQCWVVERNATDSIHPLASFNAFFYHFVENKNGIRIIKCKYSNKSDLVKHFKICLLIELHMIRPLVLEYFYI